MTQPFMVSNPIFLMFEQDGKTHCHVHQPPDWGHEHFGLAIADLIRHVANAYSVSEEDVFEWVKKEMDRPTSKFEGGRLT